MEFDICSLTMCARALPSRCHSGPLETKMRSSLRLEISSPSSRDKRNMMGDILSLPLATVCGEGEDNAAITATNWILFPLRLVCSSTRRHCNFPVQNEPEFSGLIDSRLETVLILFGDTTYNEHYFCPTTGQIFATYEALMHYVEYAKKAKVSIYAPDFDAGKSSGKRKGCSRAKTKICKSVTRGKAPCKGKKAASAALEQLPSDVGQITVPKSGISGKFPPKNWEEACLPDSKEVSPAVGQTKVSHQRTEAGSAALKQLPSDVGQNKVLKIGIGGELPPKGWKEACLVDPEKVFPAVDQTKVPCKRTEAGSAALKQLPSAVGENKVPKFGISENIPRKIRKEVCPLDAKELSPAVNETKVPTVGMRAELPLERREEACLPDLKELSPGEVNIGSMDMSKMGDFGGFQQYTPLEGGSSETNYDWAFEANIFPFRAVFDAGEEPTISALDNGVQIYMEPSRPCIEHQYRRRNGRNKSTRPTVGQLRKKET